MKIFKPYNSPQKKSDHSNLTKPLIERLFYVLINRIKKSDSPVKLREKTLNFSVKYCKNCRFVERKPFSAGKRRVSHDVIVHFTSLRGKGDDVRRCHDVKTMAKCPKRKGVM